jgi:vacuolar-type H+-ATPase subunit I/STV1
MRSIRLLFVVITGLMLATTLFAQSQQGSGNQKAFASRPKQEVRGGQMMERCKAMMERRQQMLAEMKAMDTELDKLVAEMNSAPESKKADAVAAVVSKMVEQRKAMHEKMQEMQMRMTQHMTEHMQAGKESMSQCPMMKEMMRGQGEKK